MKGLLIGLLLAGADQLVTAAVLRLRPLWVAEGSRLWDFLPAPVMLGLGLMLLGAYSGLLSKKLGIGEGLLLAGLLSNALSQILYGRYIDYLPLPWGVSNGADLLIMLGSAWALAEAYKKSPEHASRG